MGASASSLRVFSPGEVFDDIKPSERTPARGVLWVLRWAAALAMLVSSAAILVEFGYCLAAEQTLARAARAGVLEATLPRATYRSVEESVWRRLGRWEIATAELNLRFEQNGAAVRGRFVARAGDRFAISLAVPTRVALPAWLRAIAWRPSDSQIVVRAERRMPGAGLD